MACDGQEGEESEKWCVNEHAGVVEICAVEIAA